MVATEGVLAHMDEDVANLRAKVALLPKNEQGGWDKRITEMKNWRDEVEDDMERVSPADRDWAPEANEKVAKGIDQFNDAYRIAWTEVGGSVTSKTDVKADKTPTH